MRRKVQSPIQPHGDTHACRCHIFVLNDKNADDLSLMAGVINKVEEYHVFGSQILPLYRITFTTEFN